jgi:hypothetical protein
MFYFEILEGLYEKKIRYLIVGGLSVNLYGVPRLTQDIDIIISTDRENILKIITVLKNHGYVPRLPVNPEDLADSDKVKDWIENGNLKAFSFYHKKSKLLTQIDTDEKSNAVKITPNPHTKSKKKSV